MESTTQINTQKYSPTVAIGWIKVGWINVGMRQKKFAFGAYLNCTFDLENWPWKR